jgi:hypothetical protein
MLAQGHPIHALVHFLKEHPEIFTLEVSLYSYAPQAIQDDRIQKRVRAFDVLENLSVILESLPVGYDLAFHSRVRVTGTMGLRVRHLPLLDFQGPYNRRARTAVLQLLREMKISRATVYSTGRSFHAYLWDLVPSRQWTRFMGLGLLLNAPTETQLVDARWIGHRLMGGFGSLRWSCNGPRYLQLPTLTDEITMPVSRADFQDG